MKRVCTAKLIFINCFPDVKDTSLNALWLSGDRNVNVFLSLLRGIIKYRWHLVGRMKSENFPDFKQCLFGSTAHQSCGFPAAFQLPSVDSSGPFLSLPNFFALPANFKCPSSLGFSTVLTTLCSHLQRVGNFKRKFEGTRKCRSQRCYVLTADFRQVGNDAEFGEPFEYKLGLKTERENLCSHFSDTQNFGFCEICKAILELLQLQWGALALWEFKASLLKRYR